MHLGGPSIEMLGPDRARTTRNLLFVGQADGAPRHAIYHDDLVRTPDGWRISNCRCQFVTADGLADRPPRPDDQARGASWAWPPVSPRPAAGPAAARRPPSPVPSPHSCRGSASCVPVMHAAIL
nr:nuclear transport factor 2 family protein [Pseudofrankia sp. DC12]